MDKTLIVKLKEDQIENLIWMFEGHICCYNSEEDKKMKELFISELKKLKDA